MNSAATAARAPRTRITETVVVPVIGQELAGHDERDARTSMGSVPPPAQDVRANPPLAAGGRS